MEEEKFNELCRKLGLSLHTKKYSVGEDWWCVSRQQHGSEPPEVNFSGTYLNVVTFVVGYNAGHVRVSLEKNALERRIIDAMKER